MREEGRGGEGGGRGRRGRKDQRKKEKGWEVRGGVWNVGRKEVIEEGEGKRENGRSGREGVKMVGEFLPPAVSKLLSRSSY